jgi:hypothetical protein
MIFAIGSVGIIGQAGVRALGVFEGLAVVRAPEWFGAGLTGFLFETQWLYWAAGIVLAAILFHLGRSRDDRRLKIAAGVTVGLVLVWALLAYTFTTSQERLAIAHESMAEAARKGDVAGILAWFTADFQATALGIMEPGKAREEIDRRLKEFSIKKVTISNYRSDMVGDHAETRLTVSVEAAVQSVPTTWRLTWEDEPGVDWRVSQAELLKIGPQDAPPGFVIGR